MKTVYLSGPMKDKPNLNKELFASAQVSLEEQGYTVLNPHKFGNSHDMPMKNIAIIDLMRLLNEADMIAMLPGCDSSMGANAERAVANWVGIPVYDIGINYYGNWWMSPSEVLDTTLRSTQTQGYEYEKDTDLK